MPKRADDLTLQGRDLLERSIAWMDRYWDPERGLLWGMDDAPDPRGDEHAPYHIVRESVWYALGLLIADRAGDAPRAVHALEAVLLNQFDRPDEMYHGTFRRAPEEPDPPDPAIQWLHYDPNWREFIITTVAVILSEFESRLPRALVHQLDAAIRKAVEGTLTRPLTADYTNIALMNAHMLVWAGDRLAEPDWVEAGEAMGSEVYRLFTRHDAFEEYNSPTYYGPDLYAIGLWQAYCPSPRLHQMGAEMEAALWRDIALFYHAGLKNLAGPYDRSYGMDMRSYAALLGAYIWLITGREDAAFPDVNSRFAHAADFCFGPVAAVVGTRAPQDVVPHLTAFQGERCVERVIADSPRRVATAWLADRVMIGAQYTSLRDIGQTQFHPATIHWQAASRDSTRADTEGAVSATPAQVGWVRLLYVQPVDASAGPGWLSAESTGQLAFLIAPPQSSSARASVIRPEYWRLPGLEVEVESGAQGEVTRDGDRFLARYTTEAGQAVRVTLRLSAQVGDTSYV